MLKVNAIEETSCKPCKIGKIQGKPKLVGLTCICPIAKNHVKELSKKLR